jgi:hypothetical protein
MRFSSVVLPQPDGPDQTDELAIADLQRNVAERPGGSTVASSIDLRDA